MAEFYENVSLPWRCNNAQKWELIKWFDLLISMADYKEERLREIIKEESIELATDRRDELTEFDAGRVIDRLSSMWLEYVAAKKAMKAKQKKQAV